MSGPGTNGARADPRGLVRPYTVTRGRTGTPTAWPPETVVAAVAGDRVPAPRAAPVPADELAALRRHVRGPVWSPGEPGFAEEIASSYGTVVHRPRVLVGVRDGDDVAAAVTFAAAHALPVAVQATGHGSVAPVDDGVMISTRRMRRLVVDPARATVRVGAGVVWSEVITAAARHDLAPLCGSAPGVGVVGYTLGGGISPVARTFGFTADHVEAAEVVTADGRRRWVDGEHEPELFWAVRGGKGNLGVVTTLELRLFPLTGLYGGGLYFDGADASSVLDTYPDWTASLGEATTTSLSLSRIADPVHGGTRPPVVHLRMAHVGPADEGAELVAPMRALGPVRDTLAGMPFTAVGTIHDDPTEPLAVWKRGLLLRELPPAAARVLLEATGADADDPVASVEIRQLGGAMARRPSPDNAVGGRDARYGVFVIDALEPDGSPPARGTRLVERLAPFATGGAAVNFLGTVTDSDVVATAWDPATHARLVALKGDVDPDNLFRFGYAVAAGRAGHSPRAPAPTTPEARAIVELARPWRSVAEIAAELHLPLGVVRVLLTDLAEAGLVTVHHPPSTDGGDTDHLERALRGLRNRL